VFSRALPLRTCEAASYGHPKGTNISCIPMRSNSPRNPRWYPFSSAKRHTSSATAVARPATVNPFRNGLRTRFRRTSFNTVSDEVFRGLLQPYHAHPRFRTI
jgi:hypothetical protein